MKTLQDYIRNDLRILSIGLNPSLPSVQAGFYFANPRNRFWRALQGSGLLDDELEPGAGAMDVLLDRYAIGFTDVVKRPTAGGKDLLAADLLRDAGFEQVLVQLGETRALEAPEPRRPWRVAVPDPRDGGKTLERFEIANRALATSSGLASRFEASGRHHHLFDPASGRSAPGPTSVTVLAERATAADALSTALAVAPPEAAEGILREGGGSSALLVMADGQRRVLKGHNAQL